MKYLIIVLMFIATSVDATRFEVASDGQVSGYFVGQSAEFENIIGLKFGSQPLEVTPTINNHTASIGDYTSFGSRTDGDSVDFYDFVTNTYDLWSSNNQRNYDGFNHFYHSDFTLPDGTPAILVGFEDIKGGGDHDFNDAMVVFTNIHAIPPVPEPSTYAMMLVGLLGLMFTAKRKGLING